MAKLEIHPLSDDFREAAAALVADRHGRHRAAEPEALRDAALTWAHEQGYRSMTTDWRCNNLLSSRYWPARGCRPTFMRLYRAIP
jgi:hypothetical protein